MIYYKLAWWVIPILSFVIFVLVLVFFIKKKLTLLFTVVVFLLFSVNTIGCAVGNSLIYKKDSYTVQWDVHGFTFTEPYAFYFEYDEAQNRGEELQPLMRRVDSVLTDGEEISDLSYYYIESKDIIQTNSAELVNFIMTMVDGFIILSYIIYEIVAAVIVRKRIRQNK
jgi:hypothetical protein